MVTKDRYQWGNKSGRWLAKAVSDKKHETYISKIRNDKGGMMHSSPEIAEVFHSYYKQLL